MDIKMQTQVHQERALRIGWTLPFRAAAFDVAESVAWQAVEKLLRWPSAS
jgi:hypothetical protein